LQQLAWQALENPTRAAGFRLLLDFSHGDIGASIRGAAVERLVAPKGAHIAGE
jgi:hypothetical protein